MTAPSETTSAVSPQGHAVPIVAERPDAAGEGNMAGATRQGGAVSEQGPGRGELSQLREGSSGERQEDLLVWHQRLLAPVFLEGGECLSR